MPVCAHTRTSDFRGPSDGGHTGLLIISDGGTPYVLQTCQYVTLNKKIPLLYNIAFSNIYSHFIAFSKLSMNYQLNDINISYLT